MSRKGKVYTNLKCYLIETGKHKSVSEILNERIRLNPANEHCSAMKYLIKKNGYPVENCPHCIAPYSYSCGPLALWCHKHLYGILK